MLRIDLVREDVLRVTISREGCSTRHRRTPCASTPSSGSPSSPSTGEDGVVRLRTRAMVVTLWLDPLRLDVHRPDGSTVVETARDEEGRSWAYATLNDAFTFRRTCRPEDAVFGLGEKGGRPTVLLRRLRGGRPADRAGARRRTAGHDVTGGLLAGG